MKKILLVILAVASIQFSNAAEKSKFVTSQSTNISGKITDKSTGEVLAGVEVHLIDTDLTVYTDFEGNFEIKDIKPGAHAIKVQYISYQPQVENIYADANNSIKVSLKLKSVIE